MNAIDSKIGQPAKISPAYTAKGHRIDLRVLPIEVLITPQDHVTEIRAGEVVFVVTGTYYIGGHILCVRYGLASGTKMNPGLEPVWGGVYGQRRLLARASQEVLIEVDVGDVVDVFHTDGMVSQLEIKNAQTIVKKVLSPDVALEKRLAFVRTSFQKAARIAGRDEKIRLQDRNFHELASLLRLTEFFPHLRQVITTTVGHHVKMIGQLSTTLRLHFLKSIRAINDDNDYWWLTGKKESARTAEVAPVKYGMALPASPLSRGRKPLTQAQMRAYTSRRDARRAERNANCSSGSGATSSSRTA